MRIIWFSWFTILRIMWIIWFAFFVILQIMRITRLAWLAWFVNHMNLIFICNSIFHFQSLFLRKIFKIPKIKHILKKNQNSHICFVFSTCHKYLNIALLILTIFTQQPWKTLKTGRQNNHERLVIWTLIFRIYSLSSKRINKLFMTCKV